MDPKDDTQQTGGLGSAQTGTSANEPSGVGSAIGSDISESTQSSTPMGGTPTGGSVSKPTIPPVSSGLTGNKPPQTGGVGGGSTTVPVSSPSIPTVGNEPEEPEGQTVPSEEGMQEEEGGQDTGTGGGMPNL